MRRFEVEVEVLKRYVVEIDDSKFTEEDLEAWESVFHDLDLEDDKTSSLVLDYCEQRARLGNRFIEGHGIVLDKGKKADGYFIQENEVCDHMTMIEADDEGDPVVSLKEISI